MAPVGSIRNLGPATEAAFAGAGIETAEALRAHGADPACALLIASGYRPHFMACIALVTGLQGRPWSAAAGPEKTALRTRFDALLEAREAAPETALERDLDALDVRVRTAPLHPSR